MKNQKTAKPTKPRQQPQERPLSIDFSKEWMIIIPPEVPQAEKAAGDLSRCMGLLTALNGGSKEPPEIVKAFDPAPPETAASVILNCEEPASQENGFAWRAKSERVEIFGKSARGLCNGIYSFIAAMGVSWPAPGQEKLPRAGAGLSCDSAGESSHSVEKKSPVVFCRRFMPAGKKGLEAMLNDCEAFAEWAGRNRYDALVIPLEAFVSETQKLKQLEKFAGEYGIALEAGGHELSSLVPRKRFFLHKDYFRMEDGKREKDHHFCPTSPGAIHILGEEAIKLFRAAENIKVFHLWPDKGAETAWCFCPTCRAFTTQEQNRMGVNAAADVLAALNPDALITFYEKSIADSKIQMRKNTLKMEKLPEPGIAD
jgi:hypothetical protein